MACICFAVSLALPGSASATAGVHRVHRTCPPRFPPRPANARIPHAVADDASAHSAATASSASIASAPGGAGPATSLFYDPSALPRPTSRFPALRILGVLWRFSRPHTIYGSLAAVVSMSMIAWLLAGPIPWPRAAVAVSSALLMNVYIVGLNQVCDVEIDRVNKPYLPIPAGDLTALVARRVILLALTASAVLGFLPAATPALRVVLFGSAALGTAYSLPPLRLKRHAFLASVAILSVRGLLVNSCFFLHAVGTQSLVPLVLPPLVTAVCVLFVVFGVIIALLKDVPDIRGDRIFNIRTFSVRIGAASVFRIIQLLLFLLYACGAAFSLMFSPSRLFGGLCAAMHALVAAVLLSQSRNVDPEDGKSVYRFYMNVWKAFYLEYAIMPLAAL